MSCKVKSTRWVFQKECDIIKEIFPSAPGENSGTVCLYELNLKDENDHEFNWMSLDLPLVHRWRTPATSRLR